MASASMFMGGIAIAVDEGDRDRLDVLRRSALRRRPRRSPLTTAPRPSRRPPCARPPRTDGAAAPAAAGLSQVRSNMSGIRMRPISSTSRKPRVVIRPVRAPLRCRMVLEPTVVPCSTSATAAGSIESSASSCATPSIDSDAGIGRRRGDLALMDQAGIGQQRDVRKRAADIDRDPKMTDAAHLFLETCID